MDSWDCDWMVSKNQQVRFLSLYCFAVTASCLQHGGGEVKGFSTIKADVSFEVFFMHSWAHKTHIAL